MLTRATGKLLPVLCPWLLSSVLLFVEVNSKSGCLGQGHRNQAGKLCWRQDGSLLCVFAVGRGEPGAERDGQGAAEVPGRCLSGGSAVRRQDGALGPGLRCRACF